MCTIEVDVLATVWNLIPVSHLAAGRAEFVLVAEDALDFDFFAHVLQVEVSPVLSQGPKSLVLLELIVEVVLTHVLYVFDAGLARTPRVVFNANSDVSCLQGEALWAVNTLNAADKVNLLWPVLAEHGVNLEQVRSNGKGKVVTIFQIWVVVVRCRNQTWFNANHLRDVPVRLDRVGHGCEHECGTVRVANEVNLLASNASLVLLIALRVHNQFDHCWDVVPGDNCSLIVKVSFCIEIIIDRIIVWVRDGVPCASNIAEPNVISSFKECRGQERFGNVATPMVKPSVRVLCEAVQEQHNTLGPLVRDLLSLFKADDAEHGQLVIVIRRAVIRLPVDVLAPSFESLVDLGVVLPVVLAGPGVNHHAAILGREE